MDYSERCERFDEYLDDVYGEVAIGGSLYSYGRVWRRVDEIAYNCALNDFEDGFDDTFEEDDTCTMCGEVSERVLPNRVTGENYCPECEDYWLHND